MLMRYARHAARLGFACWVMAATPSAHAQGSCPGTVTAAVAKHADIKLKNKAANVVAAACKVWPYDPKTLLSAFAFDTGDAELRTVVVAMVDAGSGRVVRSHATTVTVDSAVDFGEYSFNIDTAPYQLAKDVRAFGLRFTSSAHGPSCAQRLSRDELTLFVPDAKGLRPVLQGLAMNTLEVRDNDCIGPGSDAPIDEATLSLGLAPTAANGLADLVVTAQIVRQSPGADAKGKPRLERHTLHYDGKEYQGGKKHPWWLGFPASLR
jgi:hypothetical protein